MNKKQEDIIYQVWLEVSLKNSNTVLGFINISQIAMMKFEEIFKPKIKEGRRVFQDATGYVLELEIYEQHKEYLDKALPFVIDFKLFH